MHNTYDNKRLHYRHLFKDIWCFLQWLATVYLRAPYLYFVNSFWFAILPNFKEHRTTQKTHVYGWLVDESSAYFFLLLLYFCFELAEWFNRNNYHRSIQFVEKRWFIFLFSNWIRILKCIEYKMCVGWLGIISVCCWFDLIALNDANEKHLQISAKSFIIQCWFSALNWIWKKDETKSERAKEKIKYSE